MVSMVFTCVHYQLLCPLVESPMWMTRTIQGAGGPGHPWPITHVLNIDSTYLRSWG